MYISEQNIRFLLSGALLSVLILVVIILIITGKNRKQIAKLQRQLTGKLEELEDLYTDQFTNQRSETLRSLHQLNESLVNTFVNLTRSQNDQISASLRQNYDNAQAMQRIVEEALQRMENRMQSAAEQQSRVLMQNEARIETLRKTVDDGLKNMREENDQKLSEIRSTVEEKLTTTLEKRLSSSFAQVSERLEQVYRSLGEVHSLASGVGDLKRMLGNVKTRGVWGEIQLGALLEQALTEAQYQHNIEVVPHSNERVEFAVCLPGREEGGTPVYMPIDSKFPQEAYVRLAEAAENGDATATEAAQKALLSAVRVEAKRIGKYIAPPYTTDFAVMFLPTEGLYAEVMRHAETVETIQREQRILISGPSTLLALLNSLQMGFRTLAIEQRSAEVWKLLGAVKSDFGNFAALLQKTQEKLRQATDSIDTAFVKTRAIEKRLRRVETLEEGEAQQVLGDETM